MAAALASAACAGKQPEAHPADKVAAEKAAAERAAADAKAAPDTCPDYETAPALLPGTRPEHTKLAYWLGRYGDKELDRELLDADGVRLLNQSMRVPREGYFPQRDLLEPIDPADAVTKVAERVAWMGEKIETGEYLDVKGAKPDAVDPGPMPLEAVKPTLRLALDTIQIYCEASTVTYYGTSLDPRIDHNLCSSAHTQEPVLVIAEWPAGMKLVRTRYTMGWIPADAPLSPPLAKSEREPAVRGPFATVVGGALEVDAGGTTVSLPEGTRVGLAAAERKRKRRRSKAPSEQRIKVATADGLSVVAVAAERIRPVARPFTRRAILTEAFRHLGEPYGFGGKGGARDCSRLFLDVFESFGIELPRHSLWQSRAGSFSIDFEGVAETERWSLIEAANQRGVVLMELPGHIMMYLGKNDEGEAMALHAFAEYKALCEQPDPVNNETTMRVDNITVSNLELGRGTSKTAFIERVRRIVVFGAEPDLPLEGAAEQRPAAHVEKPRKCRHARGYSMFTAPMRPNQNEPLKVMVFTDRRPGPAQLVLEGPGGVRVEPEMVRLGGPPYGWVAEIDNPRRGTWTAILGDGDDTLACRRVSVAKKLPSTVEKKADKKWKRLPEPDDADAAAAPEPTVVPAPTPDDPNAVITVRPPGIPIWSVRRTWSSWSEDLFALFVERLFDYPVDQDLTWKGLHVLLRDKERNIFYNYLGLGEDEKITLFPDCAELSYTLRAYFSWKMGLPYAYTQCKRARPGKPPECQPGGDNLMTRAQVRVDDEDDVGAFQAFTKEESNTSVNSSSGRTHPDDEVGDYYPVALTRSSLKPGTLFNDPYGHVIVVADWVPQGAGKYGVLIGADAQPDGTVGRRRFWRGSFLWKPDIKSGGAGFKAYRPAIYDKTTRLMTRPENKDLSRRTRWTRYSSRVYDGSADDFYRRMESLINPRPLDPEAVMVSLVDALSESVVRRVVSVDNGEEYMRDHGFAQIKMPTGKGIFLTSGPWEDFATPSRDLRLLISIHTVLGFPAEVEATPDRYSVPAADAARVSKEIATKLRAELSKRTFEYTRSDGSKQTVTLADVVDRRKEIEMAYNPNDCVEIRWAAPEGSAERKTCNRTAPADQRAEMQRLRGWFSTRERPFN